MSRDAAVPESSAVRFHGPKELATLWEQFAANYTTARTSTYEANAVAMLDRIVFGEGVSEIVRRNGDNVDSLAQIKYAVEDAALALSDAARSKATRPLHRAVVASLMQQWLDIERRYGVESNLPPKRLGDAESDERQSSARQSSEGTLLAGIIRMTTHSAILTEAQRVHRRIASRHVTIDDVLMVADRLFESALRRYRPDEGSTFNSFLIEGLKSFLSGTVFQTIVRNKDRGVGGTVDEGGPTRVPTRELADRRELSPSARIHDTEKTAAISRALESLPDAERRVLMLRVGLAGGKPHTLQEIADQLGLSKEGVRQVEARGLERCRRYLPADFRANVSLDQSIDGDHGRGR